MIGEGIGVSHLHVSWIETAWNLQVETMWYGFGGAASAPLPRVITSIDFSSRMLCVVVRGWSGGIEGENAASAVV